MNKKFLVALAVVLALVVATLPLLGNKVSISGEGKLSIEAYVALAASASPDVQSRPMRYLGEATVVEQSWGYLYTLENGDIVEVGDSSTSEFRAHVKTIRWNDIASFSLELAGGAFIPSLNGNVVSFQYNDNVDVSIYPVAPSTRLPEGGIEYDITLGKKPAKPTVTLDIDWNGITWQKILPLNEEYDQAACIAKWGDTHEQFVLTQTSITGINIETQGIDTLKHIEEYEVNSYLGIATTNWHSNSGDLGGGVTYSNVSRSYLYIHRGQMTDALNDTAWVEDINIDEQNKTITFDLPKEWLRTAEYPVSQICGVDPAYTEGMDYWVTGTYGDSDNTWSDYDIFTEKSVPKGAVAEIIIESVEAGVEMNMGIRTDGSSLARYFEMHEAEAGGYTHIRMFVLVDESTGLVETFCEDVTDDMLFHVVGYWENVTFDELAFTYLANSSGAWVTEAIFAYTAGVYHIILRNSEDNTANTMGIRAVGSSLDRKVLIHEPESGGNSYLDMMVKPDVDGDIQLYSSDAANAIFILSGYFGEELDFVELFQQLITGILWQEVDLTEYLDEDERVCDFLLGHSDINDEIRLGVRNADSGVHRSFSEHEAEDDGGNTGEVTGFGISAQPNADGQIDIYHLNALESHNYLMGYFKPAATSGIDITNLPTDQNFGIVSGGDTPETGLTYFTITNNSGAAITIYISGTDAVGGTTHTLSDTATPGHNIFGLKAGLEGGDYTVVVKKTESFNTLVTGLANEATQRWGLKLYTPTTYTNEDAQKTTTVTLSVILD